MNRLIALAMLLFAGTIAAQDLKLPKEANSASEFAPEGWRVYFNATKEDLNGDQIKDLVFVLRNKQSKKRVLVIAFGQKKSRKYVLHRQDDGRFIWPKGNKTAFKELSIDKSEDKSRNNVLRIDFLLPGKQGFEYYEHFKFRFQNGRFELIGWDREVCKKGSKWPREVTSVNFSTQTVIYEDRTKKSETRQKHFDYGRLKSLGEVVPGEFSMNYDKL